MGNPDIRSGFTNEFLNHFTMGATTFFVDIYTVGSVVKRDHFCSEMLQNRFAGFKTRTIRGIERDL